MNATLPSKTSLKQYQEAITTLETKKSLTAQSASIKQERFDLGQRLSQLQRKARNIMDELGGYESNSARYANEIESLKDELQNVTSEIDSITQEDIRTASALIDVEQKVATTNKVVTPITLQIHRDKLATERAKLEKLAEHRDKLEMEQCGELTSELETEWQDLLARQAVGEEVKQRLEEVFSQLSQQQAAHASKAASTKSTLAGLDRMIAATEASIATLDKQHDGLSAMFWRDKVITAADDYEQLSAQTASALMHPGDGLGERHGFHLHRASHDLKPRLMQEEPGYYGKIRHASVGYTLGTHTPFRTLCLGPWLHQAVWPILAIA